MNEIDRSSTDAALRERIPLSFQLLPKKLLSVLTGYLTQVSVPQRLVQAALRSFVRFYHVNVDEAARPLETFRSLNEFFTRDLRDGARPIGAGVVAPVDGAVSEFGSIDQGRLLQIKGLYYSAKELLSAPELGEQFESGFFITFYLSPPDYHHAHMPVSGALDRLIHVPGQLWPVNSRAVCSVPGLFVENERVVFPITTTRGPVALVMVGALNVGAIGTPLCDFRSNRPSDLFRRRGAHAINLPARRTLEKGERCGTFHLGSTVVLLFGKGMFQPSERLKPGPICLGESIGELLTG